MKDPLTGQPFTGNVIPAGQISPVSQNFVKAFWTPPQAAGIVNNDSVNALHPYTREKYDARVDYNFSSRHTLFVRFGLTGLHGELPTVGFTPETNFNQSQLFPGRTAGISDTFIDQSPHDQRVQIWLFPHPPGFHQSLFHRKLHVRRGAARTRKV